MFLKVLYGENGSRGLENDILILSALIDGSNVTK